MNRLQSEITELREYAIMQFALMQCIALKMGICRVCLKFADKADAA